MQEFVKIGKKKKFIFTITIWISQTLAIHCYQKKECQIELVGFKFSSLTSIDLKDSGNSQGRLPSVGIVSIAVDLYATNLWNNILFRRERESRRYLPTYSVFRKIVRNNWKKLGKVKWEENGKAKIKNNCYTYNPMKVERTKFCRFWTSERLFKEIDGSRFITFCNFGTWGPNSGVAEGDQGSHDTLRAEMLKKLWNFGFKFWWLFCKNLSSINGFIFNKIMTHFLNFE